MLLAKLWTSVCKNYALEEINRERKHHEVVKRPTPPVNLYRQANSFMVLFALHDRKALPILDFAVRMSMGSRRALKSISLRNNAH